ncbi:MAG: AI-2E family transporter [Bacteroidales bacterium]|nr:AI-2E family transporter [Bacteroidales bacterium]
MKRSTENSPFVIVAAIFIIMACLYYAKSIITPMLLALFISIICIQPISWFEKKGVPGWLSIVLVILGLIVFFTVSTILIGGTITSFLANVSKYESSLSDIFDSGISYLHDNGYVFENEQGPKIIQPEKILSITANVLNNLIGMMGNTFLIVLTVVFILTEFDSFPVKANAIVGGSGESIAYFSVITKNIRQYLWIKTLVGLLTGVMIYLSLLLIGVDYPVLWAMIGFVLNYIPNFGSVISIIPTMLFALVQLGVGGALWTLGALLIIHNIIGNLLEPKIMGKGLGLSTLVVFLSLVFWGFIFGTVGMFLSVPITMTLKIFLEQNNDTRWIALLLGTLRKQSLILSKAIRLKI